jgi:hypothetical protein
MVSEYSENLNRKETTAALRAAPLFAAKWIALYSE